MNIIILIITFFYIIPAVILYHLTKLNYSKNGRWSGLDADIQSVVYIFIPLLNIMACLFMSDWKSEEYKKQNNFPNKFFGLKKNN